MQREHRRISRGGRRALALGGALALAVAGSGTAFASAANPIAANEWALNYLNVTQVRDQYKAHGAGVIVAVIDTGVDPNQPDLKGRLVDGVNLVNPETPTSDYSDTDSSSHGTSVATVIAGQPHLVNGANYGMIGLADQADIMPIKAGISGSTNAAAITAGIQYAVNHGAAVINISQGGYLADSALTSAIDSALAHGVIVVVAAGNDAKSGNQPNDIADVPGVLDVGGIDSNGQKYSFGHYGSDVNIAAPANDIEVGLVNGQYNANDSSGTSLAAPWVAGEAALLVAEHPTWTSGQIIASIIDNTMQVAEHITSSGQRVDDNVGFGVIDPLAALGASEPSSTTNPLGGPPITSTPAQNVKSAASSGATGGTSPGSNGSTPTASGKSSSKAPLIVGIVVVVVVLAALLIFLLSRRNRGGRGGPGGGGGGGSNGYYTPPNQPGGQYAVPPQQQGPYQQNPYQQGNPNPYVQPQQQPGVYPPPQAGGYGQQQNPQNPYSGG